MFIFRFTVSINTFLKLLSEFKVTNVYISFFYMVAWFEKSKEIILSWGNSKDEAVINMIEDLFDLLMVTTILIH